MAIKLLGLSHEDAIDIDVAHMARLGFNAYRVHMWDKEISDSLVDNIQHIIDTANSRENSKGGLGLSKSRINSYKNLRRIIKEYQGKRDIKVRDVDINFGRKFLAWMLNDKNYAESYTAALPDFVKLAEAYGCVGLRAKTPDELDEKIKEMININQPVIFDCVVDKHENCFPMIPSGKPHNQMLLGPKDKEKEEVSEEGKVLV